MIKQVFKMQVHTS